MKKRSTNHTFKMGKPSRGTRNIARGNFISLYRHGVFDRFGDGMTNHERVVAQRRKSGRAYRVPVIPRPV